MESHLPLHFPELLINAVPIMAPFAYVQASEKLDLVFNTKSN